MMCKRGHKSSKTKNGQCHECMRETSRKWKIKNKERYNLYQKEYRQISLDKIKRMIENEDEIYFEKDYRKRKSISVATPAWVNKEEIRHIYKECVRLSEQMHMIFEVGHIIPIKGKRVCGLHIANNLEVVSPRQNQLKANKFNADKESREYTSWIKEWKL